MRQQEGSGAAGQAPAEGQEAGDPDPARNFRGWRELANLHQQRPALGQAAAAAQRLRKRALSRVNKRQRQDHGPSAEVARAGKKQRQDTAFARAAAAAPAERQVHCQQQRAVRSSTEEQGAKQCHSESLPAEQLWSSSGPSAWVDTCFLAQP